MLSSHIPALQFERLSKRFGGTQALADVDLTVMPGEIHGLLGENGSGKSTLIKVLAGYHKPDSGSLSLYGKVVSLPLPAGGFRDEGVAFVHQDLALIPELSVVENLWIDRLAQPEGPFRISWSQARRDARDAFARYGVELDPGAPVATLEPVERALLAIVRAAESLRATAAQAGHPGVLVLDEPTVFLPATGTQQLFSLVRRIAESGASVLFVSHDLAEVLQLTDRVTVLRDGRRVATVDTHETSEQHLVELIIGRRLTRRDAARPAVKADAPVQASISRLSTGRLNDLALDVHRGEVLGVTGLAGSGHDDLLYAMFGARQAKSGELKLAGRIHDLTKMSPLKAICSGLGLIPADRQNAGSIGTLTLEENLTIRLLDEHSNPFFLPRGRLRRQARAALADFDVRPNNPELSYSSLSGGNQQKVLMAKWLLAKPSVLLLDEPTQGVDVGAREQIFDLIREVAAAGASVICASCDYEQLATLCERVLVFGHGTIVDELVGSDITKDSVAERCYASLGRSSEGTLQDAVSW